MDRQQELSGAHIRLFLAVVLRNPTVFAQFKNHLPEKAFADEALSLVWRVVLSRTQHGGSIPSYPELLADVRASAEQQEGIYENPYMESSADAGCQFLQWAFDDTTFFGTSPDSPELEEYAFRVGRLLLLRAHTDDTLRNLSSSQLHELPFVLREAQMRADLFASFDAAAKKEEVFAPGWDRRAPLVVRTTGFPFFDRLMGGGEAGGEAYLFMAPMGTCKTVFAVMKWVESARQAFTETFDPQWNGKKGLSVLVSYEASMSPELQHRSLSYAAKVHKDSLQAMGYMGIDALNSTPEAPLPYEMELFSQEIADGMFVPERQRVERELRWMNSHLVCFDFSGSSAENSVFGLGGVPGILQRLQATMRAWGDEYYLRSVVIDYLGLMADRYNRSLPAKAQLDTHVLYQSAVDAAVNLIAKPYDCPIWIMHQLSGEANSRLSPTSVTHHTQGKGSKMVGENATFCFQVGHLTKESMGVLTCTKRRRYKPMPNPVIQVRGAYNGIVALDNYSVDSRGVIVDRATESAATGARRQSGDAGASRETVPAVVDGEAADSFSDDGPALPVD